jgi:hypothetical protein
LISLPLLWIVVIFLGSLLPSHARQLLGTERHLAIHVFCHFIAFGTLAWLLSAIARTERLRLLGLLLAVALGLVIEWLEHAWYFAPFEISDVRDDTLAALIGFLAGHPKLFGRFLKSQS